MDVNLVQVRNILTRTSGYLKTVTSHSLQPYRGCSFGGALCGVGCYVRHNPFVTRGRAWGGFLDARINAVDSYRANYQRERRWARARRGGFSIFLSSATDPFLPQEKRLGITRRLLECQLRLPADELIVQTHTHRVGDHADLLAELAKVCRLRVHISIETDLERIPGLPPHASPIDERFRVAADLKKSGVRTVITVSPLLPLSNADRFFQRIARSAHAVVIDHFIGGDGTSDGRRTRATPLPQAMEAVLPESTSLDYRNRVVRIANQYLPGRVGVGIDGFAGRYRE